MPIIIHRPNAAPPLEKFQCMLAASEIPTPDQLKFPLLASMKLDGIRSPQTGGVAMSRKMLPLPNKFIQSWAKEFGKCLHGLDGEIIVGPPNLPTTFNTSTSGVMSQDGEPDFKLYVFEHWNLGDVSAHTRDICVNKIIKALPQGAKDHIVHVGQTWVDGISELQTLYDVAIGSGYEGLILKDPLKAYKRGRSSVLSGHALKWKEFIDINCVIIEVKQGKKNLNVQMIDELGHIKRSSAKTGKMPVPEVGGFVVKCIEPESPYYNKTFSCGPGSLCDDELHQLWFLRDSLPNLFIKVKAQKSGAKDLPRYPGFQAFIDPMNMGGAA